MKKVLATQAATWIYRWIRNTIRHPKYGVWIILGSFLYLLSPVDISPDVLPVVGWIDDGLLATIVVAEVSTMVSDRLKNHKRKSITQPDSEAVVNVKAVAM